MPATKIAPSVLASDLGNLNCECKRMMDAGADWLHMDIMDGHFVPNIVMGAPIIASVSKAVPDIFMDCHMMVTEPGRWVKDIAEAGGASYTFHLEATDDPLDVVRQIRATGMRAAVAINPGTPSSEISNELGAAVDMILVMTVWPGAGGQKFMKECMPKVAELRARFPDLDVEVDGGVGPKTIDKCAEAGANIIVAGTAIFNADSPPDVIHFLRTRCDEAQARIKAERERIIARETEREERRRTAAQAKADEGEGEGDGGEKQFEVEIDGDGESEYDDDDAYAAAQRDAAASRSRRPSSPMSRPRPYLLAAARAAARVRQDQLKAAGIPLPPGLQLSQPPKGKNAEDFESKQDRASEDDAQTRDEAKQDPNRTDVLSEKAKKAGAGPDGEAHGGDASHRPPPVASDNAIKPMTSVK